MAEEAGEGLISLDRIAVRRANRPAWPKRRNRWPRGLVRFEREKEKGKNVREQRGNLIHRGKSWFLRYCDNVMQPDGSVVRKVVCKKLPVPFCDDFRTKASVRPFAHEI